MFNPQGAYLGDEYRTLNAKGKNSNDFIPGPFVHFLPNMLLESFPIYSLWNLEKCFEKRRRKVNEPRIMVESYKVFSKNNSHLSKTVLAN